MEGRVYLEDYFDPSGIEIDKILYLALMNRPGLIWNRDEAVEEKKGVPVSCISKVCRENGRGTYSVFYRI